MSINITLLGQMITFAVLVWFTMKYVWPPLTAALEERKQKIAEGLAAADRGASELEKAQQQIDDLLKEARQQATEIVDQAHKRANTMVDEAKGKARDEQGRIVAQGHEEVQREMEAARENLRGQVSVLALQAASKILEKEVDANAHSAILNKVAAEL